MKQRNPIAVFLLPFITLGIYSWYWLVKTKGEMNKLGESIPTAWIWLIPFVGVIWWLWKYSEGVERVTNEKLGGILSFVLLFLLGNIGNAIIQDTFNKTVAVSESASQGPPAQSMANQAQPYYQPDDQISDSSASEIPTDYNQPAEQPEVSETTTETTIDVAFESSEPTESSESSSDDSSSTDD